jgi:O-acetyl-ADP-ribose deacetylase (regulator of RNase III)
MPQLHLKEYTALIHLTEKYTPLLEELNHNREKIINALCVMLLKENMASSDIVIPEEYEEKRKLLRGLLNVRKPKPFDGISLKKLNTLLQTELTENGVVEVDRLEPVSSLVPNILFNQADRMILWQGDITQLKADAIVNAANEYMLGCFQPLHACIDNAIHSAAGPQLRLDCHTIMTAQAELEKTGGAKITRGYNLPANFVLHTVGPIVPKGTELTVKQKKELDSCYTSCLEVANEIAEIKTVAFCAISTGVFGFPKTDAANIAVHTVNEWLNLHPNRFDKIVFNVFTKEDYKEYLQVFQNATKTKEGG